MNCLLASYRFAIYSNRKNIVVRTPCCPPNPPWHFIFMNDMNTGKISHYFLQLYIIATKSYNFYPTSAFIQLRWLTSDRPFPPLINIRNKKIKSWTQPVFPVLLNKTRNIPPSHLTTLLPPAFPTVPPHYLSTPYSHIPTSPSSHQYFTSLKPCNIVLSLNSAPISIP